MFKTFLHNIDNYAKQLYYNNVGAIHTALDHTDQKPTMKRINIYLTNLEKKKIYDLKNKYHISFSTIANIVCEKTCMLISDKELQEQYVEGKEGTKTSIKPKYDGYKKNSFIYTNTLKIFLNDRYEKYVNDKTKINKMKNFIYNEMQNTYEENWDGNRLNRLMPKLIKNNKTYYKKLLEE